MADNAYFLVADILGFGQLVSNSSAAELDVRMNAWTTLVERLAVLHGIDRFQLISDTLFVGAPSTDDGLSRLVAFSRDLLSTGLLESFPVRGAIAHGNYCWGKLTYGPAVINAHVLEQAQNWVGITCEPALPRSDSMWGLNRLICYPPPLKKAKIQLHPVISWDIPDSNNLFKLMTGNGLVKPQEHLTWDFGEKMNNTVLFRLYQEILRKTGAPCSRFYGALPVSAVESAVLR